MAPAKKSAAVAFSAWCDFDPSHPCHESCEDVCDYYVSDYNIGMSPLAGRQVYSDRRQNLLWAIKCKQTSRGCEFTTGNDLYLKGYQTQMELKRKLLRKRNPGVKH